MLTDEYWDQFMQSGDIRSYLAYKHALAGVNGGDSAIEPGASQRTSANSQSYR